MELNNNDEIEISEDSDAEATTTQTVEKHPIRSIRDFIPPSSTLTKPIAAELSLVYHSVRQNISCGKTKARELSVNVLVFSIIQLEVLKLFKGNCFCHVLSDSVKTSHQYLPVDVESYLSQLYSHFSSSSKYVANLKDYFEFVEEDYLYTFSFLSSPSQSSS
ncbi:unnamed protein product [Rotaria sordida]|uniref:Uncharacterized protein n=1 Tax=Rotaria sordida TaxID=392033 RepID=A0A819H6Y0_9BILA|nr:unnamed protein product [Rotaria sordida]